MNNPTATERKGRVIVSEMRVPAQLAPFWECHARHALKALETYTSRCSTLDEKMGELGVLANLLLVYGDSFQAHQLAKTEGSKN